MAIAKKLLQQRLYANTLTYSGLAGLLANLMSGCGPTPAATENLPTLSIADVTISEAGTDAVFTVTLSEVSDQKVTVNYKTLDDLAYPTTVIAASVNLDYTSTSGTLTFTPKVISQAINVPVLEDTLFEFAETVTLELFNPDNATIADASATLTITDNDDPPTIAFTELTSSGLESVSSMQLNVELSAISAKDVTVTYTVSGTAAGSAADYSLIDGTLIINAGEDSATITIDNIIDDAELEDDETIIVTFSNPSNATLGTNTTYTYTIIDNDDTTAPTASAAARFHFIDQTTIDYTNSLFNGEAAVYFSSGDNDIETVTLTVGNNSLTAVSFINGKATVVIPEATFISEIKDSSGSHIWNNLTYTVSDSSDNTSQTASIETTTSFLTATSGDKVAFIDHNSDGLYSVGETVYATLNGDKNSALDGASMSAVLDGVIGAMDSTLDNISAATLKTVMQEMSLSYSSSSNTFTQADEQNPFESVYIMRGPEQFDIVDYLSGVDLNDRIQDFDTDTFRPGYNEATMNTFVSSTSTSESDFLDLVYIGV